MHISLDLAYAEGSSKTSCGYSLQRKFDYFVFFNSLTVYNNSYTETNTYE